MPPRQGGPWFFGPPNFDGCARGDRSVAFPVPRGHMAHNDSSRCMWCHSNTHCKRKELRLAEHCLAISSSAEPSLLSSDLDYSPHQYTGLGNSPYDNTTGDMQGLLSCRAVTVLEIQSSRCFEFARVPWCLPVVFLLPIAILQFKFCLPLIPSNAHPPPLLLGR